MESKMAYHVEESAVKGREAVADDEEALLVAEVVWDLLEENVNRKQPALWVLEGLEYLIRLELFILK